MNAGIGVSATPANGTAQTNSTAKTTTTASAGMRSRRVAGMFERKMLRSSPIVVSGKLAANAPWQELQRAKTIHPARSDIQPILGAAGIDAAGIASPRGYANDASRGINPRLYITGRCREKNATAV